MLDDHSELVPLLPIPNRTVKRLSADDSADSRVKVGHRQACICKTPHHLMGRFLQRFEKTLEENAEKGVTMEGFADRSGCKLMMRLWPCLRPEIVNKIQPISVGV